MLSGLENVRSGGFVGEVADDAVPAGGLLPEVYLGVGRGTWSAVENENCAVDGVCVCLNRCGVPRFCDGLLVAYCSRRSVRDLGFPIFLARARAWRDFSVAARFLKKPVFSGFSVFWLPGVPHGTIAGYPRKP